MWRHHPRDIIFGGVVDLREEFGHRVNELRQRGGLIRRQGVRVGMHAAGRQRAADQGPREGGQRVRGRGGRGGGGSGSG